MSDSEDYELYRRTEHNLPDGMSKGALIITCDPPLSEDDFNVLSPYVNQAADQLGLVPMILTGGMKAEVSHDLSGLIAAITAQTEAINHLAGSNMALVDAMLAEDGDEQPVKYMDGSPVQ